ncbi:MAG: FAD-binding oxidoreductase [Planctomycetaceae bacterium]
MPTSNNNSQAGNSLDSQHLTPAQPAGVPSARWHASSTRDVVKIVQSAIANRQRIIVLGNASEARDCDSTGGRQDPGSVGTSGVLCLDSMNKVIDYPARDMTITVEAGMTAGQLQQILSTENQQLPVEFASSEQTIGSLVSSDTSGPSRFGYGTLRDYVIGIEAVDGQGRTFQAGGRVVKNVAGYDFCRLMTGSRGQLGILTHVTFKLKPLPEHSRILVFGFNRLTDVESSLNRLNLSAATPVILDVMNRRASTALLRRSLFDGKLPTDAVDCNFFIVCCVEGSIPVCEFQIESLCDELHDDASWKWIEPPYSGRSQIAGAYCQTSMSLQQPTPNTEWQFKLTTLPSRVVSSISMLENHACMVFGRAGNGVLYFRRDRLTAHQSQDADVANFESPENAVAQSWSTIEHTDPGLPEPDIVAALSAVVEDEIGSVTALKAANSPRSVKGAQSKRVSELLRKTFDPHGLFVQPAAESAS